MRCIMGGVEVASKPFLNCPKPFFQSEAKCRTIDFFLLMQITLVFALSLVLKASFWNSEIGITKSE